MEPVQERRGGGDLIVHVLGLLAGGGLAAEAAAKAAKVVPDGIPVQGTPVAGIGVPGGDLADPPFEGGEPLVPGGERACGDQHRPHVDERAALRQRVERLVGDDAAIRDGGLEGSANAGLVQPVQHEVGTVDTGEGLAEPVQFRCGSSAGRVKAGFSLRSREQRVHSAVDSCQVSWHDAHRFQKAGSGLRQRAQSGSRCVPPFSGAPVPQHEQVTQRLRHRSQTAVPVAREMPIRPPSASPQMLQGRSGPGLAALADRPGIGDRGDAAAVPAFRAGFPAPRVAVPAVLADGLPAVIEAGRGPVLPAPAAGQGPGLAPAPGADAQSARPGRRAAAACRSGGRPARPSRWRPRRQAR